MSADLIKIEFTAEDAYSIEVAKIDVGDYIDWLPKDKGHNVDFLAGPNIKEEGLSRVAKSVLQRLMRVAKSN